MKFVTIGVYGSNENTFFQSLIDAKVCTFCDIRMRRGVRGSQYSYVNSQRLQKRLGELGIRYLHLPELAPNKETRLKQKTADQNFNATKRQREELCEGFIVAYQEQCLKDFNNRRFIESLDNVSVVALFCVEANPQACHRSIVSNYLKETLGVEVDHI